MGARSQAIKETVTEHAPDGPEVPDKETAKQDYEKSRDFWSSAMDEMSIMQTVQLVGSAVVAIAIITIVVNEVLTTEAVENTSGPFDSVIDTLGSTGVAAMSLLVVGLLVAAASQLMSFMRGGF